MQVIRTAQTLAATLLIGTFGLGSAAQAAVPAFVGETLYSPNAAVVSEIMPTLAADVVILAGGLKQGLRRGMVCRVTRGPQVVGELIIIESRSDRSAGLILELVEASTIQAGDIARIKTIQNS